MLHPIAPTAIPPATLATPRARYPVPRHATLFPRAATPQHANLLPRAATATPRARYPADLPCESSLSKAEVSNAEDFSGIALAKHI